MNSCRIHITGIVQGVGFRPFVCLLAERLRLNGWVRNTSRGVDIEVEGSEEALQSFIQELREGGPPRAHIETFEVEPGGPWNHEDFTIIQSQREEGAFQPISPDISICDECLEEMRNPGDRRYRYPFINCTNCGPRFTIIRDIPYDRPNTTMDSFTMCADCAREYSNPADRRFHAQPVACPVCGPQIWLEENGERVAEREEAISAARKMLADGYILAIKGLGGFHLACDASNSRAVTTLRQRKQREEKPFALMAFDTGIVEGHSILTDHDRVILESSERPILLLQRKETSTIAPEVTPGLNRLGFMLPYTPLHYLLLEPEAGFPEVVVMTSGNLSEEPIAYEDEDARQRLSEFADGLLFHDRPIHMRCDDPVVGEYRGSTYFFRRSRGYAPLPILLPFESAPLLAAGGEFKNSFCLLRDRRAFLSHFIGEMDCLEAFRSYEEGIEHYERLFRIRPTVIAYDLHPDYQATRYALRRADREGLHTIGIQHHHAHIASCLADNGLSGRDPVIGVSFDGTGYGTDGAIWGGEFLIADYTGFARVNHLSYCPLPGGDAAIRNPYRTALSWMREAGVDWSPDIPAVSLADEEELAVLAKQLETSLNAPPTSSMGRLFDAVASLAGVRHQIAYEAQAACELEAVASPEERDAYSFDISEAEIDPSPVIHTIIEDVRSGVAPSSIAARFHSGVACMVGRVCSDIRDRFNIEAVALSGGVWQNMLLLDLSVTLLEEEGFTVYIHRKVPANDGGLALGQAVIAASQTEDSFTVADVNTVT